MTKLLDHWPDLVAHCGMLQPALRRHLRDSLPVSVSETVLEVGFDPEFAQEIEEVRAMDHGTLHTMFTQLLGRSVRLQFRVLDKPVTWSHVQAGDSGAEEPSFNPESAGTNPREWLKNQTVRRVLEVFNGELVDVQPAIPNEPQGETKDG